MLSIHHRTLLVAVLVALVVVTAIAVVGAVERAGLDDCPRSDFAGGSPARHDLADQLRTYGERHPGTFAGLWGYGGSYRVAFTGDLTRHQSQLDHLVGDVIPVEVVEARWTLAQLRGVEAQLSDDVGELIGGSRVHAMGVRADLNRIAVMVSDVGIRARVVLSARYPDMVCLEESELRPVG